MDILTQSLRVLGFTDEEISVYIATLEEGSTTALVLARTTGIPRTTVYLLIESLTAKGMIREYVEDKKKSYRPAAPSELLARAHIMKQEIQTATESLRNELPQLDAVFQNAQQPLVRIYNGIREVERLYERMLLADKLYIHSMISSIPPGTEQLMQQFDTSRMKKMIPSVEIRVESPENRALLEKYGSTRNQIMCVPAEFTPPVELFLFETCVVHLVAVNGVPTATVIDDNAISQFERMRFHRLFEGLCDTV